VQNFARKIPEPSLTENDKVFVKTLDDVIEKYISLLEKVKLKDALRETMSLSSIGNKYFQDNKVYFFLVLLFIILLFICLFL
jgi:methionyl-tRNA synthetase